MGQRYNSKGKLIESNYEVRPAGPGVLECAGCGKRFSAHGGDLKGPYSWAVDGRRWEALNRARAARHADRCKGGG